MDRLDDGFDIEHAFVGIILLEIAKGFVQFGFDIGVEFHAGCEPPEDVERHGQIALGCPAVAFLADACVQAKYLWNHDNRGGRRGARRGDIEVHIAQFGDGHSSRVL